MALQVTRNDIATMEAPPIKRGGSIMHALNESALNPQSYPVRNAIVPFPELTVQRYIAMFKASNKINK